MDLGATWAALMEIAWFDEVMQLGAILLLSWLVFVVVRRFIVSAIRRLISKTRTTWDDALVEAEAFAWLAHLAPIIVVYYGVSALELHGAVTEGVKRLAIALTLLVVVMTIGAVLTAVNDIYSRNPENRKRPIQGYVQLIKLFLYVMVGVVGVAILLDRSPLIFLSGIGAMTAVLLLVFKDTILSLVASIQLTGNDMLHVGDWIEMPSFGADGDVIDIALHTVKVQNWDKTITTIPTYALISGSFRNWRGMSESESRRIKRAIHIDVGTIRFLELDEIERLGQWALLRDYMAEKCREIDEWNAREGRNAEIAADIRKLTNIGTFRAYVLRYLQAHPKIHPDRTLLVRQLAPSGQGVPIELYCFTNDIAWANYEEIQADLFDHLFAIAAEFGLRIFQQPAGADLDRVGGAMPSAEAGR